MPGRTPYEVFKNYLAPLERALLCVTQQRLMYRGRVRVAVDDRLSVTMNQMNPVRLRGRHPLLLTAGQIVRVYETGSHDPNDRFAVREVAYLYEIAHVSGREVFSFHWTAEAAYPGAVTFPHLHIGPALLAQRPTLLIEDVPKVHVPTGPIALGAVVRLLIVELGVVPLRADWMEIIEDT